ncbi:Brp/Blh family beta-carotene 15,15'-monooxygenase [Fructobacillus ficulneus]|uniref:Brp/Blh family beta-carotene 15,15'-monooxygenase n=2 Tax=Fructobacillus ficulneus TaxID=157463 RepID=A0A0K8MFL8_9LACO|nr:Brp/Blh family beta-carotene 15,15'-monooxygenase [Fructobacillus ficulneus]
MVMVAIILPIHAGEEWQLPGGFHYQYNLSFGSDMPNIYPMNRLTDMLTVCIAEVAYIVCIFFYQVNWVVMALCAFCFLEVFMHTFFGIKMYNRFKNQGKKTLYNPGMASGYLGFGVTAIAMVVNLANHATITGTDWVFAFIMLLLMALFEILLPERLFRSKDTSFPFTSPMYFTKFLK